MSYPERLENHLPRLALARLKALHFEKTDMGRFPCLTLGYEASRIGGTMPAVLNAANEIAVQAFLEKRIGFPGIPRVIERTMMSHFLIRDPELREILDADRWARREAGVQIQNSKPETRNKSKTECGRFEGF